MATAINYRVPGPLHVTGSNIADDRRRFREQYENYEILTTADLADKCQGMPVFLTCVGNELTMSTALWNWRTRTIGRIWIRSSRHLKNTASVP